MQLSSRAPAIIIAALFVVRLGRVKVFQVGDRRDELHKRILLGGGGGGGRAKVKGKENKE